MTDDRTTKASDGTERQPCGCYKNDIGAWVLCGTHEAEERAGAEVAFRTGVA